VPNEQTRAWWVERPCRIVVDIAFLMLGAAQRVFDVRAGEFMRRATLLRCGSSRLSFIMLFSWGMCSGSSTASIMAAVALLVQCAALGTPPVDVFFARLCLVMQRMSGTGCLVDLSGSLSSDPAFSRGCRGPEAQTTSAGSWGSSRRHVLLVGRLIVLMASCKPSAVPNVWFTALWLGVWVQQGCSVFPELPSPRGYAWCLCVWP